MRSSYFSQLLIIKIIVKLLILILLLLFVKRTIITNIFLRIINETSDQLTKDLMTLPAIFLTHWTTKHTIKPTDRQTDKASNHAYQQNVNVLVRQ